MPATEKYADLKRDYRALMKLADQAVESRGRTGDEYWLAQEAFKVKLQNLMLDDEAMQKLPKSGLLHVIAWCSTYRPFEPHVILTMLSRLNDR